MPHRLAQTATCNYYKLLSRLELYHFGSRVPLPLKSGPIDHQPRSVATLIAPNRGAILTAPMSGLSDSSSN